MDVHHSIFELHLLRIAKFTFGVRQFIAAFNDGIYSVPSKCREINFTKQGGNKLPHSMERCRARKSKIHSNIFEITSPFEVGSSMLSVRCSACLYLIIRHSNVRLFDCSGASRLSPLYRKLYFRIAGILPAVFILFSCCTSPDATRSQIPATQCVGRWWRSIASPLIGSLASCRQSLSFLPAARLPMPPGHRSRPRSASGDGGVPLRPLLSDRWSPDRHLLQRNARLQSGFNGKLEKSRTGVRRSF
jgi:hypothetical protein